MDLAGYASLTEEELISALATELYGDDIKNFGPEDLRRYIEDAREWLKSWVSRNRQALCKELERRGLRSAETMDAVVDLAALMDIIIVLGLHGTSAAIVTAIIAKWGIRATCE